MTTPNLSIPQSNFDSMKQSLKDFVKQQGVFSDVDFEGSYINNLLDILAYNSTIDNFYYTMASNESSASTAKLRNNVIARAQENGYVPKSFSSATALVAFTVTSNNLNRNTVVIPSGTSIIGRIDNRSYTFSTTEPVVTTVSSANSSTVSFTSGNITVYEGINVSDSYTFNSTSDLFEITNEQVDTTSLVVSVIEDQGNVSIYTKADDIVNVTANDKVYFVRVGPNGTYTIYFGNGMTGYRPKLGSVVVIDYRVSNGQLPNGIATFVPGSSIDGEVDVKIQTVSPAQGGDIYEDIESIRFNGNQANITQNRSLYQDDFRTDIVKQFSNIGDISEVGGEDVFPPKFGKIIITGVDKQLNALTQLDIEDIREFLTKRSSPIAKFVFSSPNIIRVGVNVTPLLVQGANTNTVRTQIAAALSSYAENNLGKFGRSAIESKIQTVIDNSSSSIIGNTTQLTAIVSGTTGTGKTYNIANPVNGVQSTLFNHNGTVGRITNINDQLFIVDRNNTVISDVIGTVDVDNGVITTSPFNSQFNQSFDLMCTLTNSNIIASGNMILKLLTTDVTIQ